ncbi:hypothetical protein NVP1077O_65 [Vibrio phage 1.077.O._10N.261.45.A10]|nr:hypothetical protein NVP1070O_65 [Vibrio phage 1.070.O._10N.261.45.B2]AUR85643.1 hypothetical protein NVP1077O_65 [Vibrio phage 1.077.O._10N.261.45.A10]
MKVLTYLSRLIDDVERGTVSIWYCEQRIIEAYQTETRPHVQHEIEELARTLEVLS